jgi:predicted transcriptional regulator
MASSAALTRSRAGLKGSQPSSSGQFWNCQKQTRALLSIKKPYADAIFRGEKLFEFRRSVFRKAVDVVIVYVTSPTCQVAGEFDVSDVISESVEDLWNRTSDHAGIDREGFFSYFEGCEVAHAIVIGKVRKYREPLDLGETFGIRAPQSFVYV